MIEAAVIVYAVGAVFFGFLLALCGNAISVPTKVVSTVFWPIAWIAAQIEYSFLSRGE